MDSNKTGTLDYKEFVQHLTTIRSGDLNNMDRYVLATTHAPQVRSKAEDLHFFNVYLFRFNIRRLCVDEHTRAPFSASNFRMHKFCSIDVVCNQVSGGLQASQRHEDGQPKTKRNAGGESKQTVPDAHLHRRPAE